LISKSTQQWRTVYDNSNKFLTSKYFFSPFLYFAIPSYLSWKYALSLKIALSPSAPLLIGLASIFAGVKRYQYLTSASNYKGASVVQRLLFNGESQLQITSFTIYGTLQTTNLNVSQTNIQLVETSCKGENYYLIRDQKDKVLFILPLSEGTLIDRRLVEWINRSKTKVHEDYDITNILLNSPSKLIDTNKSSNVKNNIENLARIHLLSRLNTSQDISTLTDQELIQRINTISDRDVNEFLVEIKGNVSEKTNIETQLVQVENLLVSAGLNREDATKFTKFVRNNYRISKLSELKHLSDSELNEAFHETVTSSNVDYEDMRKYLDAYLNSLKA
jgi:hypothetical protein